LLPTTSLTSKVSVGLIEVALLLAALFYIKQLWRQRAALSGNERLIVMAFLFNLVIAASSLLQTGLDWRFLENPLKMVLATTAIGLIFLLRPPAGSFWIGLFAGTVGAMMFAIYQRFGLSMLRAEGFSMPITFGDIAMSMGLMSLAGIQLFSKTRWAAMPYVAFTAGVVASILSGSRGGWLALLLSAVPVYSYGRHAMGRRAGVIIAMAVVLLAAVCVIPQVGVRDRLTDVAKELHQYKNGNPDSSVGARLEMWKGAIELFAAHPIAGVGRANYNRGLNMLVDEGRVDPSMREYYHAHNEFLNALATQGILGGLALFFVYAAPLFFFTRQLRDPGSHRPYALAGVLLVLSFIDFGLTQVMFAHHIGSAFYAVSVCTLTGLCLLSRDRQSREVPSVDTAGAL
jgi:O-antigen ligase